MLTLRRVLGSQIQLAGWSTYSTLLWILKAAMCTFYYRLTKDLEGYRTRIYIGFGLIISTWVAVELNLLMSCMPLHKMWQIYPDPGKFCYPAISPAIVWTYLAFNVATDIYLIMIPMPMLWKAAMPPLQKFWLIALFSCGLFVTVAAVLRAVLLVLVCLFLLGIWYLVSGIRTNFFLRIPSMALSWRVRGQCERRLSPSSQRTYPCSSHT